MSNDVLIRIYQDSDRESVRRICCDVADKGDLIENIFPDREIAADLLTGYYIDYEPLSSRVALVDGYVVGYINGCLDNRRYGLVMMFVIIPQVLLKALIRGLFLKVEFWRFVRVALMNVPRLFSWRRESFDSHQAHLHLGISKGYQAKGLGKSLLNAFEEYAHQQHVKVLTASVNNNNQRACVFFEKQGFKSRFSYPMVLLRAQQLEHYQSVLYVKDLP